MKRWRLPFSLLVAALGALVAAWLIWRVAVDGPAAGPTLTVEVPAKPVKQDTAPVPRAARAAGSAARSAVARAAAFAVASAPAAAASAVVWDVCGIGHVPMPPSVGASGADLPAHLGEFAQAAARERLLAAMDAGDARARAAAAIMRSQRGGDYAALGQALIEQARGSSDPVVLGWAAGYCLPPAACQIEAAADWVRLEPGNAAAWLALMERQPECELDALRAMAQADRFTNHYGALIGTVLGSISDDLPRYLASDLILKALLSEGAASSVAGLRPLLRTCQAAAPGSEQKVLCRSVARLMIDEGDTMLAYFIGLRLQVQLGDMPQKQASALRAEMQDRLIKVYFEQIDFEQPYSCSAVDRRRRWATSLAQSGEMKMLRKYAAAASAPAR